MAVQTRPFWATAVVFFATAAPVAAQTWRGVTTNGAWNEQINWSGFAVPTSGMNTALTFGAASNPGMTNNISGTFVLNNMTFTSAATAYTLTGNPLEFRTNGLGGYSTLVHEGSNGVTISNNVTVTGGLFAFGLGTGTVNLSGPISGNEFLVVNRPNGTVVLVSGSNTYNGGGFFYQTAVNGGTLRLGSGTAIPTGGNVLATTGGTFNIGSLSNSAATAIGTLNLDGGTFRVPSGNGDYHLNDLLMNGGGDRLHRLVELLAAPPRRGRGRHVPEFHHGRLGRRGLVPHPERFR